MSPPPKKKKKIPMLTKNLGVLVNALLQLLLAYMSSASGGSPQTPTRVLPLDPGGGLLSPVPQFCSPPKQISGYAPVFVPKIFTVAFVEI